MLTLVSATLNARRYLERALASAATQAIPIQHILVDGGSTDGTVEICRRFSSVDLTIAPGCSIYEAWNIGLDRAAGDAVMFLNADDELPPDAAAQVEKALGATPDAGIIAGRAAFLNDDNPQAPLQVVAAAPGGSLDARQLALGVPVINAMAFRREVFDRYGRFETRYRVAGDRAFLLRLALSGTPPKIAVLDAEIYLYHVHSGSLTLQPSLEQRLRIARDHVALARQLLASEIPSEFRPWLKHWHRREAVVALLRCLAAGRPAEGWKFFKLLGASTI